jgi:2-succinyl-5-enolpyruvyl-6-hydroxy-3-cyclohexene-1-carboxylate synthase
VTEPSWVFARTLVDELARAGLTDAVVAPGSRSAPLALALAEQPGVRLHVLLDERSVSFFALGLSRASGRAAAVLCTSGTAAANFHPAVIEADLSRVPLLVLTADRPPELRGTGANQTIDQAKLYGDSVRWFADPGPPRPGPGAATFWRSLAARAWAEAAGAGAGPAGPVHLNLPFDEPLVPQDLHVPAEPGREGGLPWLRAPGRAVRPGADEVAALGALVRRARRGMIVAGWGVPASAELTAAVRALADATGWPLLADPLSGLRDHDAGGAALVSTYDALLRAREFAASQRPDLVVRLGAPPTSKLLNGWLGADVPQVLLDPDGLWPDPHRVAGLRLGSDPVALLREAAAAARPADADWPAGWAAAELLARGTIDQLLDSWEEPFEGRVARDLAAALPSGAALIAGSSMPVRDLEAYAAPRAGLRYLSNRGASGIDGTVATALGAAAAHPGPVAALLGDLALLHDASSLLYAARQPAGAVLVVLDNDGGGIFSFLPQAELPRHFELLFGTPHGLDLAAIAMAAGLPCRTVAKAGVLPEAIDQAIADGGSSLVLVRGDRATNVARHREASRAVAEALSSTTW